MIVQNLLLVACLACIRPSLWESGRPAVRPKTLPSSLFFSDSTPAAPCRFLEQEDTRCKGLWYYYYVFGTCHKAYDYFFGRQVPQMVSLNVAGSQGRLQ